MVSGVAEVGAVAAELEVVGSRAAGHGQALRPGEREVGRRVAVEIDAERAARDDAVVIRKTQ